MTWRRDYWLIVAGVLTLATLAFPLSGLPSWIAWCLIGGSVGVWAGRADRL